MNEKLDPWEVESIENYEKLFKEFGIEPFSKFKEKFSENKYMRRGIIFGHRNFERIANAIENKNKFCMITGLMPSGKFHFGHKIVAEQIIWYQKLNAKIYVCAADIESYLMRNVKFDEARKIAINEYLRNYIALGLTEKNLTFWFQSDYKVPYYRLRDVFSKKVTFNELNAVYGSLEPRKIFSSLTQVADILHMQLKEFEGPMPTVVPVGADQDPHIRLTRDIAARFSKEYEFILPSSTYHKFMPGLQGGKMSSSDEKSYIALTDKPEKARKKIMEAKTGGRATIEEQRKKGGIPEQCMIFEIYKFHLIEDDKELEKIYNECKTGKLLCGEDKKRCSELMEKFLKEHQKKLKSQKTEKIVEKILNI
ncbi:MAG: tryptophan--tRNA ligase [Candidatus Altiarchaeota archaeon]